MKLITDTVSKSVIVLDDNFEMQHAISIADFSQIVGATMKQVDTGLMPRDDSGLLRYRAIGDFEQIVYQVEAGYHTVKWGHHENDIHAQMFSLLHPNKIWIADWHKGKMVGIRHFATNEPVYSADQYLYHLPLPNTNCRGYSGTSVGWVCLYRTMTDELHTLRDKIDYSYQRESGLNEPYNDVNMSETDGPRFYEDKNIMTFASPSRWQELGQNNDVQWFVDQLIRIDVSPESTVKDAHSNAESAEPYTLEAAMDGIYMPYYPHSMSAVERSFYDKGWSQASAELDLTPQAVSRLLTLPAVENFNSEEIMGRLQLKPSKAFDFEGFQVVQDQLLNFVVNSKYTCAFCSSVASDMYMIAPSWYPAQQQEAGPANLHIRNVNDDIVYMTPQPVDVFDSVFNIINDNFEDYADEDYDPRLMWEDYREDQPSFYACNNCVQHYGVRITDSWAVLNHDGYRYLEQNSEDFKVYISQVNEAEEYHPFGEYSELCHYVVSNAYGHTPSLFTAACYNKDCFTFHPHKFDEDWNLIVPDQLKYRANSNPFGSIWEQSARFHYMAQCLNCSPALKDHFDASKLAALTTDMDWLALSQILDPDWNPMNHMGAYGGFSYAYVAKRWNGKMELVKTLIRSIDIANMIVKLINTPSGPTVVLTRSNEAQHIKTCRCNLFFSGEEMENDDICNSCVVDGEYVQTVNFPTSPLQGLITTESENTDNV